MLGEGATFLSVGSGFLAAAAPPFAPPALAAALGGPDALMMAKRPSSSMILVFFSVAFFQFALACSAHNNHHLSLSPPYARMRECTHLVPGIELFLGRLLRLGRICIFLRGCRHALMSVSSPGPTPPFPSPLSSLSSPCRYVSFPSPLSSRSPLSLSLLFSCLHQYSPRLSRIVSLRPPHGAHGTHKGGASTSFLAGLDRIFLRGRGGCRRPPQLLRRLRIRVRIDLPACVQGRHGAQRTRTSKVIIRQAPHDTSLLNQGHTHVLCATWRRETGLCGAVVGVATANIAGKSACHDMHACRVAHLRASCTILPRRDAHTHYLGTQ